MSKLQKLDADRARSPHSVGLEQESSSDPLGSMEWVEVKKVKETAGGDGGGEAKDVVRTISTTEMALKKRIDYLESKCFEVFSCYVFKYQFAAHCSLIATSLAIFLLWSVDGA